jgi:predicted ATP-grasp superfamily ATP-dependent carboligase
VRLTRPGAVVLGSDFKALAAVRSLARSGVRVALVDSLPRSAWFSRLVERRIRWRGPMTGAGFEGMLLEAAGSHQLGGWMLLPTQDDATEFVSRHHAALAHAYRLATPRWDVLRHLHDKRLLHELADRANVPRPATWSASPLEAVPAGALRFPVIVKPAVSLSLQRAYGRKALVARDWQELRQAYARARLVQDPAELMIQELVPGDGAHQYSVAAFCVEGEISVAMTARRRRQYPHDLGLSSTFVEAVERPELIPLARRLLRESGVSGMVEVEFKYDSTRRQHKLLDVNVRPWAWHSLCAASGVDFTQLQYRWATGQPLPAVAPVYGRTWRRALTDVPAGLQEIRAGVTTPAAYLRSWLGSRPVPSVFDLADPAPALGDLVVAAVRVLSRGCRRSGKAPERDHRHVVEDR